MSNLRSPLFRLPRELRDQIYGELFSLPHLDCSGRELWAPLLLDVATHIPHSPLGLPTDNAIPFSMLAPLCKASKQLYWEATPQYLSSCILAVDHISTTKFLMDWLGTFQQEGFKKVLHLEFADFSQYDQEEGSIDHNFISLCPNVQTLYLKFRNTKRLGLSGELFRPKYMRVYHPGQRIDLPMQNGRFKADQAIEAWNLKFLLELQSLKKVTVSFPEEGNVYVRRGLALEWKDWIRKACNGRDLVIENDCGFDDPGMW